MKLRGTPTEKLADVVQVLQLVHRTGLLQVQRAATDNFVEEGTISFQAGQVRDASVGSLRGPDAFKKLMTWMTCYVVFEDAPTAPAIPPAPSGPASFSLPPGPPGPPTRTAPAPPASPYTSSTFTPPTTGPVPSFPLGRNTSGPLERSPGPFAAVPYRLRLPQEVLASFHMVGLSRLHRQLFLLIDGVRSVYELANLINRHPQEVAGMLADLESVGLVARKLS